MGWAAIAASAAAYCNAGSSRRASSSWNASRGPCGDSGRLRRQPRKAPKTTAPAPNKAMRHGAAALAAGRAAAAPGRDVVRATEVAALEIALAPLLALSSYKRQKTLGVVESVSSSSSGSLV